MSLKTRLVARLNSSRQFTERLLGDFHTPEQWTFQVQPNSNHALWIAGHLSMADNMALRILTGVTVAEPDGYHDRFGFGSQPSADPSTYPPPEEVLTFLRDRRKALLSAVEALAEDELEKATPPGSPSFMPDNAAVLEVNAWHEGMHAGQLTVARRALGNSPLIKLR